MTSLSEVYEGGVRTVVDRRQRVLGMSLFAAGVAMVVTAITIATTGLSAWFGFDVIEARSVAGVLAGFGLPAVFVGIFAVLPTSSATRAAAAIGASLAVFGVALFWYAYPQRWLSNDPTFALGTLLLYSAGTLLTFWCLFVAIATFKTRNDPGGTARIEITEEGKIRVINAGPAEAPSGSTPSIPGFGSVGLFGNNPDGSVPTQTNEEETVDEDDDGIVLAEPTGTGAGGPADDEGVTVTTTNSDEGTTVTTSTRDGRTGRAEPTGDGGTAITGGTASPAGVDTEILDAAEQRGQPDRYCGNCTHFEYVRVDGEIRPYCGLDSRLMDDMDACEEWDGRETDSLPR
jgi:hypothetical protein